MEQALPAAMIVGTLVDPMATLLNANRRSFSDVDYPNFGREKVAFKHVDYIICRLKFKTKAAFCYGTCL
jgi:hypothetical protein